MRRQVSEPGLLHLRREGQCGEWAICAGESGRGGDDGLSENGHSVCAEESVDCSDACVEFDDGVGDGNGEGEIVLRGSKKGGEECGMGCRWEWGIVNEACGLYQKHALPEGSSTTSY